MHGLHVGSCSKTLGLQLPGIELEDGRVTVHRAVCQRQSDAGIVQLIVAVSPEQQLPTQKK